MREVYNGIEVIGIDKSVVCTMYFDEGHFYVSKGKLPFIIKNISSNVLKQIGDFFYNAGIHPETCADKIYWRDFNIRLDGTYLYISSKPVTLELFPIGPSELKKVGIWLRKYEL